MRALAAVAAGVLLVAAAGCAPARTVPGKPTTSQHLDARRAAGIPDCPPTAAPGGVAGGVPAVALECLGGTSWMQLGQLERKPTLLVAWAQWCEPCRSEAPLLARTLPAYTGALNVVLINTNDPQTGRALDFAKDAGLTRWPVVVDPDWSLQTALKTPHVLPVSYLLAADGRVVEAKVGAWRDEAEVQQALADKLGVRA